MPELFDSRNTAYRSPFGAVAERTPVFFRICLPRHLGCSAAHLIVGADDRMDDWQGMFWAGMEGDAHEWWDCHYAPPAPGLYFYAFALDTAQGRKYLERQPDASARLSDTPRGARWQLTSYAADFVTPDWLAGGVMYQIFPDRFARSGEPKPEQPAGRILREDWGGQPEWRPDAQGEIRNNDFFQGDLKGIEQRLDRLAELGVTCLYLNPIFEAHSNHRYDTADYRRIDPLLGTEEDFRSLTRAAAQLGIRVMLDGVFSHTGADSVYFNKEKRYSDIGAYQSPGSPYAGWYHFRRWPDDYTGWWGFKTLPEVNELHPDFLAFICGEDGVARHWLREGAGGWRLDVADELPDAFLETLRTAAKAEKPDALVLGEVWEDASNKQSYGHRRRYLLGQQLDSVMNYPFCSAVLDFLCGGPSAAFHRTVGDIVENYPPQVIRLLMNHIGTHDTARALTVLAGEDAHGRGREWQAQQRLTDEQRQRGLKRMRLASALQYCLPGVPCVYYGDEAGMEGYRDPFNRGCYPWGQEDRALLNWYHRLGRLRKVCPVFRDGDFAPVASGDEVVCFVRHSGSSRVLCAVNRAGEERTVLVPEEWADRTVNLGGGVIVERVLHLPALECAIAVDNGEE